jgi:hypothetical protein
MAEGFVEEMVVRILLASGGAAGSLLLSAGETRDFAAAGVGENPVVFLVEPLLRRGIGMGSLKSGWRWRLERSR